GLGGELVPVDRSVPGQVGGGVPLGGLGLLIELHEGGAAAFVVPREQHVAVQLDVVDDGLEHGRVAVDDDLIHAVDVTAGLGHWFVSSVKAPMTRRMKAVQSAGSVSGRSRVRKSIEPRASMRAKRAAASGETSPVSSPAVWPRAMSAAKSCSRSPSAAASTWASSASRRDASRASASRAGAAGAGVPRRTPRATSRS